MHRAHSPHIPHTHAHITCTTLTHARTCIHPTLTCIHVHIHTNSHAPTPRTCMPHTHTPMRTHTCTCTRTRLPRCSSSASGVARGWPCAGAFASRLLGGVGARPGRVTGTAGERRCVQGWLDSAAVTTGPSSGPQPTARPAHGGPAGHHPPAPWQNAPVANDSASQNSCLRVMHVISTHISLARASDRLTPHVESPEEEEATRQAQKAVQCMH